VIGAELIVAMRRDGLRPRAVFVEVNHPTASSKLKFNALSMHSTLAANDPDLVLPEVYTAGADPELADLRFLHGLRVHLSPVGDQWEWASWWDAIVAANPAELFGCHPETLEVSVWRA